MKHDKHQIIDAFRTLEEISASLTKQYKLQYVRKPDGKSIYVEIYHKKRHGTALAYTRDIISIPSWRKHSSRPGKKSWCAA